MLYLKIFEKLLHLEAGGLPHNIKKKGTSIETLTEKLKKGVTGQSIKKLTSNNSNKIKVMEKFKLPED